MIYPTDYGARWNLQSPTRQPRASGFLWNPQLLVEAGCRGQWRTRHPGEAPDAGSGGMRCVYLKDEQTGDLYSAPYEPVRRRPEMFNFSVGKCDIAWDACFAGVDLRIQLSLAADHALELWTITLTNRSGRPRRLSLYPYFTLGEASDMHQAAEYRPDLEGIVAHWVRPESGEDTRFLLHERTPVAWQVQRDAFAGEGGLHNPDALGAEELACDDARQEMPIAALQYRLNLQPEESTSYRLICGSAAGKRQMLALRESYLSVKGFARAMVEYRAYLDRARGPVQLETPDENLNHLVNHWLPRQMLFSADTHSFSEQPPTADYLQDQLGMIYLDPEKARAGFLHALTQQKSGGAMPETLASRPEACLPSIHQNVRTDHCVWLVIFLSAYLQETGDRLTLRQSVLDVSGKELSVFERLNRAMHWLLQTRDERGLCDIALGDPSRGGAASCTSQSLMVAYGLSLWADICDDELLTRLAERNRQAAGEIKQAVNKHLWDGGWYVRGLSDEGMPHGSHWDDQGSVFLAPQTWALLAGACDSEQRASMLYSIHRRLQTPHGLLNMAPSYTRPRQDAGDLSLWHPGVGGNGAIHCGSGALYAYSLYLAGEHQLAFQALRAMLPGPDGEDYHQDGQLPTFMPEASFGAYHEYPSRTGKSNGVFASHAAVWVYRSLVEGLVRLDAEGEGVRITPQLPEHWARTKIVREYRGATLCLTLERESGVIGTHFSVDGEFLDDGWIRHLQPGRRYQIEVILGQDPGALASDQPQLEFICKTA